MSRSVRNSVPAGLFPFCLALMLAPAAGGAQDIQQPAPSSVVSGPGAEGRSIALNRTKGNCAVCLRSRMSSSTATLHRHWSP